MTICRKCGSSNKDDQKFCSFCHELLVADPAELAKREEAAQKKLRKAEKKQNFKRKMWKNAPFLLIPIAILDFIDLLLCLDLAFIGIGVNVGNLLGGILESAMGNTIELFGNLVYTDEFVVYVVRALEVLGGAGLLLLATVLAVIMVVFMIKWRRCVKRGDTAVNLSAKDAKDVKAEAAKQEEAAVNADDVQTVKASMEQSEVSYEALCALEAHREEYVMPQPAAQIDCAELYHAVKTHLWEYDESSVRRILSAMSCSRMLLCSAGALDSASIFDNLSRTFGVKAEQYSCPEPAADEQQVQDIARVLVQRSEQGGVTHTAFTKSLYVARYAPQNVCLAGVRGIGASVVGEVFAPLCSYFKLPEGGTALYLGKPASGAAGNMPEGVFDGRLLLPQNVWMLCVLPENDHVPAVGGALGEYTAAIYLRNSQNVFPPEGAENAVPVLPSVGAIENAVAAAEQEYFVSEELWSVVDALEAAMAEECGKRFSNRTLRALERYTSVYLACGGKQNEAFDNGLAAVIVPAYAEQLRALAKREEGESLGALLDRTVGRDRLPLTVEVLASMDIM